LELLKEIAPNVKRVAVLRDPNIASGIGQFAIIQSAAPSFTMEPSPIDIRNADEIERTRLPAVYFLGGFVKDGGLISYGPDPVAPFGQAASYADRILKGEKPADLPVQAPTKNELVINLKTAKALGLEVPLILQ